MGAECPKTCPAADKGLGESELDSSLSHYTGADCTTEEPPQEAYNFADSVAEDEAGVLGLDSLSDGLSHPAEPLVGGAQAELSLGVEAVGAGTRSEP